ncbi:MAG: Hsp33 family molecular chaperone HslO [Streptococcaceae bacterium]|jgi:molecular chaperone Hsp33|nr:Hsp33 family molecular chaperone HslO [Streptococcaceae bacterium]
MTDILLKSTSAHFRAYALDATETVQEAQKRHDTKPSSTVALGRTLMAAQILAANEKGDSKITVKVLGDGPMGALVAVSATDGSVKGYVHNPDLDYKRESTGQVIVNDPAMPLVGNGRFVVIKDMGLRTPYTGQTDLLTGEIGEDLAWYFVTSEQTPSSVGLAVELFGDSDDASLNGDAVKCARGFMLQALPGTADEDLARIESNIQKMKPLVDYANLPDLLHALYGDENFNILSESPLSWHCDCSKSRFLEGIASLGPKEITAMIEEDHGAEVICQFCGNTYHFSEKDLNNLLIKK